MKEAQRTLNPDHPDHPKNVAARAATGASTQTSSQDSPTQQGKPPIETGQATTASTDHLLGAASDDESPGTDETVKNGPHTGAKVEKSPEPVSKIWSKDKLFGECLAFTNDFANAGNLTGRAMLSFIERAQGIMNEYKKAKDAQAPKGKKK